jgi:hypothetical protein
MKGGGSTIVYLYPPKLRGRDRVVVFDDAPPTATITTASDIAITPKPSL